MKNYILLFSIVLFSFQAEAQCPGQSIPANAEVVTGGANPQRNGSNKNYWICNKGVLILVGGHNNIYIEGSGLDTAIVSITGDSNNIYAKNYCELTLVGKYNFIFLESGVKFTNNSTLFTKKNCPGVQQFYYGSAPSPGCPDVVGIEDHGLKEKIKIYPNPASGTLNLEIPAEISSGSIISIIGLDGSLVRERLIIGHESVSKIDIEGISPGLYLLRIQSSDFQHSRKISIE